MRANRTLDAALSVSWAVLAPCIALSSLQRFDLARIHARCSVCARHHASPRRAFLRPRRTPFAALSVSWAVLAEASPQPAGLALPRGLPADLWELLVPPDSPV